MSFAISRLFTISSVIICLYNLIKAGGIFQESHCQDKCCCSNCNKGVLVQQRHG
ncbi:hypothetical protein ACB098_04G008100 [Castanea mollissima]